MQATLVRTLTGFRGNAALYKLSPPMVARNFLDGTERTIEYVVVSAAFVFFSGPETYIFPASPEGEITDWGELEGSYRGGLDHAAALSGAGYSVHESV